MYKKWMRFFQRKVFTVESLKFKILNRLFPNYNDVLERHLDKRYRKLLKMASSEEEYQKLKAIYKYDLLSLRKEANHQENRNYHFDKNNPNETLFWLNKNKDIHKKGILKNLVGFLALIILLIISNLSLLPFSEIILPLSIIGILGETIGLFINTNCVLLQNYNIDRINKYIEKVYPKVLKKQMKKAKEYSDTTKMVSKLVRESESLPSVEEIAGSIQSKEQAMQLLKLIDGEYENRMLGRQKTLKN